ncbi:MAG TPA: hypothetical protein VMS75_04975 [Terriglobales bacterium]|nr:hypothetical protein [Terriglobales bacterium]
MKTMIRKSWPVLALVALVAGLVSCYHPYGYRFYPGTPRFAPTNPANVELLRRDPRREHIRIGEVWVKPDPGMSRGYVEGMLREQAAAMGADAVVIVVDRVYREGVVYNYWGGAAAYYERHVVGVAIRFKR